MNYWQFRKVIDPMLRPLSYDEQAKLIEDENEREEMKIREYVEYCSYAVEVITSNLPYQDIAALKKIWNWAIQIVVSERRRKKKIEQWYTTHEQALLYASSKESILNWIDEIISKYDFLARVAIWLANKRLWRNSNLLRLDKTKWLER